MPAFVRLTETTVSVDLGLLLGLVMLLIGLNAIWHFLLGHGFSIGMGKNTQPIFMILLGPGYVLVAGVFLIVLGIILIL